MIEDEAKTKRCCSGAAAHKMHDGMCSGSACMAWQWNGLATESQITTGETSTDCQRPDGEGWIAVNYSENGYVSGCQSDDAPYSQVWSRTRLDGTRTGVCGLVNK